VVSLIRRARDPREFTVIVVNFTLVLRPGYRIGVPEAGWYRELLNSDAAIYGGSNLGNAGGVHTDPIPDHGFEQSVSLIVPPLGFVLLKRS
jgi:1,4-alpha-glucan branching enzyme